MWIAAMCYRSGTGSRTDQGIGGCGQYLAATRLGDRSRDQRIVEIFDQRTLVLCKSLPFGTIYSIPVTSESFVELKGHKQ